MSGRLGLIARMVRHPAKSVALAGVALIAASLANAVILSTGLIGQITCLGVKIPRSLVEVGCSVGILTGLMLLEFAAVICACAWLKPLEPPAPNPGSPAEPD